MVLPVEAVKSREKFCSKFEESLRNKLVFECLLLAWYKQVSVYHIVKEGTLIWLFSLSPIPVCWYVGAKDMLKYSLVRLLLCNY